MKLIRVLVVLAGLLFLNTALAGHSWAISPVGCQGQLGDLRLDAWQSRSAFTNQADFVSSYEKIGLVWPRITGAVAPPDTFDLLTDFQSQLNALAAASPPKVDPAVAQRLVAGAQDELDCLRANNP